MNRRTINATIKAWLPTHNSHLSLTEASDLRVIGSLSFSSHDMTCLGWVPMGDATISIQLPEANEFVNSQVAALRQEQQSIRAESQLKCTNIDERIQNLLAITDQTTEIA